MARYVLVPVSDHTPKQLLRVLVETCSGFSRILLMPALTGVCSVGVAARDVGNEVGFEIQQMMFA